MPKMLALVFQEDIDLTEKKIMEISRVLGSDWWQSDYVAYMNTMLVDGGTEEVMNKLTESIGDVHFTFRDRSGKFPTFEEKN